MSYLKAYTVTLDIDGEYRLVRLDDTFPSVSSAVSAINTAMLLVQVKQPASVISLVDCTEYVPSAFEGIEYAYPVPEVMQ
tara:strand:- start:799 stop:1038 length:240 start_codon:yes stop_codon:yes gene_type:complete